MTNLFRSSAVLALAAVLVAPASGQNRTWTEPFEPFRIVGNLYFVGSRGLSSFLFVTPEGHVLLDSGVEETVPQIRANVEKLGFSITDIKVMISSHTHFDHVGGHALMQQLTGATVMAMGEDAAALSSGVDNSALGATGWKPVKVGRVLMDGDVVSLGGTTLTAHLTAGHTKGCTTWTTTIQEDGKSYRVVITGGTSVNQGVRLLNNTRHPSIVEDYLRTFRVLKELKPDVFLAQHPTMFGMEDKVRRMRAGEPNPFVDAKDYEAYVAANEKAFLSQLEQERSAAR
jgi:metallo-beta-lactamase class B